MTRTLAVLRPEPGNAATVARAIAAGFTTLSVPLFAVRALDWTLPDVTLHDALILTSANALRFGGAKLAALMALPVLAVGPHTAAAAQAAGFEVMATGAGDGAELTALAASLGVTRALHVTGLDRTLVTGGAISTVVPVYESVALPIDPATVSTLSGTVALLHSMRAARRLAALVSGSDRLTLAIASFSPAIATAAGSGWAGCVTAAAPDDRALFSAIRALGATTGD